MSKRLYRSREDRMIFGLCGGIGEYFGIDSSIVRIVVALSILSGFGFFIYIIAGIIVPLEPLRDKESEIVVEAKREDE